MENNTSNAQAQGSVSAFINLLPAGTIIPFAGNKSKADALNPQGWYLCDGSELDKNNYPELFDVLGHSCGGSSNKFKVPDLQGVFLRGVNGSGRSNLDPDATTRTRPDFDPAYAPNEVLSRQADQFREHKHLTPEGAKYVGVERAGSGDSVWFERFEVPRPGDAPFATKDTGGNETRPVNVSVNYIIFAGLKKK